MANKDVYISRCLAYYRDVRLWPWP